ncbi:LysR family substrate-binding domain-containing protein [Streptomyces sp. NPDC094448]|uniref:LysR family substrate-binding domain-containing protein n=1 Tax=Streptomyces sp. NPDC094448 TaxID=3366063 RepID=UPI003813579E
MTASETPSASSAPPAFRLACVPGATPAKWVRIWQERLPDVPLELVQVPTAQAAALLRDGGADAGLVRLPVDRTVFSAIPLYTETTVVVVPKDHLVASVDEVSAGELAEDIVLHPLDDALDWETRPGRPALERPETTADAVELVAAGVGLLVVPQSLARLHHRRDLTYRPVVDAPQSSVALCWREDATTDLVEDLIGIVRGRTVNSSRGRRPAPEEKKAAGKPAANDKGGRGARTGGSGKSAGGGQARRPGRPTAKSPRGGTGGRPRRRG